MKALLKKLIQADSTASSGEMGVAQVIAEQLRGSGVDCTIDKWGANRANLLARVKSSGSRPGLLFACHLDVVPAGTGWSKSPFSGVEESGKIYGRGSADMKGGISALVTALLELVDSGMDWAGDLVILGAAGEETDSCGAMRFVADYADELPSLAGIILPEPTDFAVVTAHRGMLWLEATTHGKSAHGSAPQLGVNAIKSMQMLLDELDSYHIQAKPHKLLGPCSISVNTIRGGGAINVVPDRCTIGMDIRTLPGQNHEGLIDDLKGIFLKLSRRDAEFEGKVSVIRRVDGLETDSNCEFVRDFCSVVGAGETKAVGFTTDGPHFAELGAPVVIFGPGKPELCHKGDEYIEIKDMEEAVEHYKKLILKFLGTGACRDNE
jgi:succinyl-diaminopimelate desuccinylase